MKKIFMLTLVFLASVCFATLQAKEGKKKKGVVEQKEAVQLLTPNDTLSYVAGMTATEGLLPYLQQQFGVDSTGMADFLRGFNEAQQHVNDAAFKAYVAGMQIAEMVNSRILPNMRQGLEGTNDSIQRATFIKGFVDALHNDTLLFTPRKAAQSFMQHRDQAIARKNEAYKKENEAWLANNAKKEGFKTLPSGLQYKVLVEGKGAVPKDSDRVVVKYEGRLIDGTVFDSSYRRDPQTNTFRCDEVIKGWTQALTMMPVGSKWEVCIPQELAYGARQAGQIKPYSTLIFTVELVNIEKKK